jgi:mono/diheme cytochrome c family protein
LIIAMTTISAVIARAADIEQGERVFESVCATCHGITGRPDPDSPVVQAFDPMPADLSDPLFNSREPRADWFMVVKHGGHAMGLSAQMPAQDANLTDEEIESVVAYVKTLADTTPYPPGEMNLMLPVRTKKAFPEDEWVWKSRVENRDGDDVFRNVIEYEKRVGEAGQTILELIHEDDGTDSEFTEVEFGYKHAFAWSLEDRSLWSAAFVVAAPLRSEGEWELAPYVAYAKQVSDSATFQGSGRVKLPVDDFDQGEVELAGIMHYAWSPWPRRVFPALEMTATIPFDDNGGDAVQFTALPQIRIGLTRGGHVALNLGVELPLSDQEYDTRYHLTLLWDFADGGFFKGW